MKKLFRLIKNFLKKIDFFSLLVAFIDFLCWFFYQLIVVFLIGVVIVEICFCIAILFCFFDIYCIISLDSEWVKDFILWIYYVLDVSVLVVERFIDFHSTIKELDDEEKAVIREAFRDTFIVYVILCIIYYFFFHKKKK